MESSKREIANKLRHIEELEKTASDTASTARKKELVLQEQLEEMRSKEQQLSQLQIEIEHKKKSADEEMRSMRSQAEQDIRSERYFARNGKAISMEMVVH